MTRVLRIIDRLLTMGVLYGLLGGAAYIFVTGTAPLASMAWDSWSRHSARIQAEEQRGARLAKLYQAEAAPTVCPDYYEQTLVVRWTGYRNLRWCEDYRDRF